MASFPVPLDNLIAYVKTLHPDGGPLANVSDAFAVSTQLDEQADALIGYFVDQARKAGLSWSQIGSAMGVTKQAAQKRFVPAKTLSDLMVEGSGKPFSRFTDRAVRVVASARSLAAGQGEGENRPPVAPAHLAAALLTERDGLAAKIILNAGLAPERVYAALGTGPAPELTASGRATVRELLPGLAFDDAAKSALQETLKWALRLGHNYIGTEHILLGVLSSPGPVREAFAGLGLAAERAEQMLTDMIAEYQQRVQDVRDSLGRGKPGADAGE